MSRSQRLTTLATLAIAVSFVIAVPDAGAAQIKKLDPAPFSLSGDGDFSRKVSRIDVMAAQRGLKRVGVGAVLSKANRKARKLGSPGALKRVPTVAGFRWKKGDDATKAWYPQGITGSSDAVADSKWGRNRVLLVSWYHKGKKGVRISFVRVNSMKKVRYRHVLLVDPDFAKSYQPLSGLHAGGIAWYGKYLYVADTTGGLRVFDVSRMYEVKPGKKIGCDRNGCRAANYRYVLPEIGRYVNPEGSNLRFSFVSVNRGTKPDSLVTGEYVKGKAGGRLVRWRLDAKTGLPKSAGGRVPAWTANEMGMTNVQGALSTGGRFLLSASGKKPTLWSAVDRKKARKRTWAYGPEDLNLWPRSGRLFSLSEHPRQRTVFAVQASKVL